MGIRDIRVVRQAHGVKFKEKKSIPCNSTKKLCLAGEDPEPQMVVAGGHLRQILTVLLLLIPPGTVENEALGSMDLWSDLMQLLSVLLYRY